MSNITAKYVEEYIRGLIPLKEDFLFEIQEYAYKNNVPIVHPEVAQLLKVLTMMKKPKRVLEIGTAIGYSALTIASCMDHDSRIITIERQEDMVKIAKSNIKNKGYENKIEVLKGEAETVLKELDEKFDLIFLDAAKGKYKEFFSYFIDNLNDGGIIVSDNVLFKGMVATDELVIRRKKTIVKRMRDYLKYISNHEFLETCVIPIGDGVAITYKKEVK